MNEKFKQAKKTFKLLCEHIIHDLNRYNKSDIDKDYFYNPKYECGFVTGGKTLYTADILKALEEAEENENELENQNKILKEELNAVNDFRTHYKNYQEKLANNLKTINCMQEEETTNRNLIDSLEDRNDRLVERLEKQKVKISKFEKFVKIIIEKEVNICVMICSVKFNLGGIKFYNRNLTDNKKLTQEEYDLLEEVISEYESK